MRFSFAQRVAADPGPVFAFFADPGNLAVLHRDDPGFRLLRHAGGVRPGDETWVVTTLLRCVPIVLGFRHTAYDPPRSFAEQLVHGPFAHFTHRHEFRPVPGGTLVRDELELRLPWTWGGELALRGLLAAGVTRRFALRHRALARIFAEAP